MATPSAVAFKDGAKYLRRQLTPLLSERGFRHLGDLSFGRGPGSSVQMISFGARRGRSGEFCFSLGAGVRFDAIEALLRPGNDDLQVATVAKPLSVLKPSSGFPEWCFDGQREPEDVITDVVQDVDRYAIPFLETCASLEQVAAQLETPDPRHWFVLSPEQRLMTLVAVKHVQGHREDALLCLDQAITERKDAPQKVRWPLEKLRERLVPTA